MNAIMTRVMGYSLSALLVGVMMPPVQAQQMMVPQVQRAGVSAQYIGSHSMLRVTRLEPTPDGGVCVTVSSPFKADEVLVIDESNRPQLMTMDGRGNLSPHPTRRAGVHNNEIVIVDNSIDLRDLADNPMPTVTYNEALVVYQMQDGIETPVSLNPMGSTPITEAAFTRPLPGAIGGIEREVALRTECPATVLPVGWRMVIVDNDVLILDERGVIQEIVPDSV